MQNFVHPNPHCSAFSPKQQREATSMESSKIYYSHRCRQRTYECGVVKYPATWGAVEDREWKRAKLCAPHSPWYSVCTKAIVISKGSYVYGELKNVLPSPVQKTYLPVKGRKIPGYMRSGIEPRMKICETLCTQIPMVPRMLQSNAYIKGKLRVWRGENYIALVGAENVPTSAGS